MRKMSSSSEDGSRTDVQTHRPMEETRLPLDRSSPKARLRYTARSLRQSPTGVVGLLLVLTVVFLAVFGPYVSPYGPRENNLRARFAPPGSVGVNGTHILGTDQMGRDILSRIIAGCRVSLVVGLTAALIAGSIGVSYGLTAGFVGGVAETFLMRIADGFLGIPYIVLVVAVSGVVGAGLSTLILILGFTGWVTYARVTRGETLLVRELEYVTAARVIGETEWRIMLKHVLPNVLTSAIVLAALQVGTTILAESSLSFLGLGVQPPTVTWGLMLADGRQYLGSAWWMSTFPGIAITLTVLGVVFVGDWLRDVLDPRMRA